MNAQLAEQVAVRRQPSHQAPRLVEVIGPAGAGKSTLCQALLKASARVGLASFPDVRSLRAAPFFVRHGFRMIGSALRRPPQGSRRLTAREFAWLCILDGWPEELHREWESSQRTNILDQGPVYLFSELHESGPEHIQKQLSNGTWQARYERWAAALDAIVWLDAPDEVLIERIRAREKAHLVKEQPDAVAVKFIHEFRAVYAATLRALSACNASLIILRFDTNAHTADEIAGDLAAMFSL